jgi:hypothetical protein
MFEKNFSKISEAFNTGHYFILLHPKLLKISSMPSEILSKLNGVEEFKKAYTHYFLFYRLDDSPFIHVPFDFQAVATTLPIIFVPVASALKEIEFTYTVNKTEDKTDVALNIGSDKCFSAKFEHVEMNIKTLLSLDQRVSFYGLGFLSLSI